MADFGLNHIPFGLRESDEAIVDVYAVKRGRECGCICPSCGTPLIARQGEEKVWHFTHASRHVYDRTEQECDFAVYVSVRLMARQLIGSRLTLALPDYRSRVTQYVEDLHQTPLTMKRFDRGRNQASGSSGGSPQLGSSWVVSSLSQPGGPRVVASGDGVEGSAMWSRIWRIAGVSVMNAMIRIGAPHEGQRSGTTS